MNKFDEIDEFLDIEPVDESKENKIEKVEKRKTLLLTMNIREEIYIL